MKSLRTYQRNIKNLKDLIYNLQWVCPTSNSSDSCSGCGNHRHFGCKKDCVVAKITKDFGEKDI